MTDTPTHHQMPGWAPPDRLARAASATQIVPHADNASVATPTMDKPRTAGAMG